MLGEWVTGEEAMLAGSQRLHIRNLWSSRFDLASSCLVYCPEQGVRLLGLLLTGSTGQHMAGRNGLA
jgi:hypothetical protein